MKTSYRFIDAEGDEIGPNLFSPGAAIPVRMEFVTLGVDRYVKLVGDLEVPVEEEVMIVTLRYLHDE
jgi:hypothetical protein